MYFTLLTSFCASNYRTGVNLLLDICLRAVSVLRDIKQRMSSLEDSDISIPLFELIQGFIRAHFGIVYVVFNVLKETFDFLCMILNRTLS